MDRQKLAEQMKAEMDQVIETLASQASDAFEDMAAMERKI